MLLMDEPLASLDGPRKQDILPYLERLRDGPLRLPILYVSHAVDEVARLADTLVLLKDGGVARAGPIMEVMADPAAVPLLGVREAGAVIDAQVVEHAPDGLTRLKIDAGELHLPGVQAAVGTKVRLRVLAQDVMVSVNAPHGLSALNVLPVTVEGIQKGEGPGAAVSLRAGRDRLLARITARAVAELGLETGASCFAVIKATSVAPEKYWPLGFDFGQRHLGFQLCHQLTMRFVRINRQFAKAKMHVGHVFVITGIGVIRRSTCNGTQNRHRLGRQFFAPIRRPVLAQSWQSPPASLCQTKQSAPTKTPDQRHRRLTTGQRRQRPVHSRIEHSRTAGSKPCSAATPWMTRNNSVVVTGNFGQSRGQPASTALPLPSQLVTGLVQPTCLDLAQKSGLSARPSSLDLAPQWSRLPDCCEWVPAVVRSNCPQNPPMTFRMLMPKPPASRARGLLAAASSRPPAVETRTARNKAHPQPASHGPIPEGQHGADFPRSKHGPTPRFAASGGQQQGRVTRPQHQPINTGQYRIAPPKIPSPSRATWLRPATDATPSRKR
ncbi:Molybdenum import ATP-binding protein ModC [Nymphon striatum]|nr:Molybdenum import ATP-binding protein ModC [Nymphon striatum]